MVALIFLLLIDALSDGWGAGEVGGLGMETGSSRRRLKVS